MPGELEVFSPLRMMPDQERLSKKRNGNDVKLALTYRASQVDGHVVLALTSSPAIRGVGKTMAAAHMHEHEGNMPLARYQSL